MININEYNYKNEIKKHFRNKELIGGGKINYKYFNKNGKKMLAIKNKKKIKLFNINNDIQEIGIKHLLKNRAGGGHNRIENILKNVKIINEKYMTSNLNDKDLIKIKGFLENIDNEKIKLEPKMEKIIKKKNLNNIEQKGGMLFYIIDHFFETKAEKDGWPKWIHYVWIGLMELLDLALDIASSIPGLQAVVGLGFALDLAGIVLSFLRMDFLGVLLGLLSIIPVVGDVLGAAGQLGQKGLKILKFVNKASKHADKVVTTVQVAKQVSDMAAAKQSSESDMDDY